MVVVAAGRNKRRLLAKPLHNLEAQDAVVKRQRLVEAADLQMDVANARPGRSYIRGSGCHWGS